MLAKKLKVLELYAGTRSIGKAFEERGHEVYSVEWDRQHPNIDWYVDIATITAKDIIERFGYPDVIWMSPDCTTFSVAGISHHRRKNPVTKNLDPISEYAATCDNTNKHTLKLIEELKTPLFFIENPRAAMRKMDYMQNLKRDTVTYCQYASEGELNRMKPTDIWNNHPNPQFKPICKNGDPCHISAPRGSTTGTQGMKNKVEKAKIPKLLCEHIVKISEEFYQ